MMAQLNLVVCTFFRKEFESIVDSCGMPFVKIATLPCSCSINCGACDGPVPSSLTPTSPNGETHILGCLARDISQKDHAKTDISNVIEHDQDICFNFFACKEFIDQHTMSGAYITSPGWLENWPQHLKAWGFNQELGREFFADFARRIVLLDTGIHKEAPKWCQEFAEYIGLPWKAETVGLEHATIKVQNIVLQWQLGQAQENSRALEQTQLRQNAEMAAVLELLAELTSELDEQVVVKKTLEMLTVLFAPKFIAVASVQNGAIKHQAQNVENHANMQELFDNFDGSYEIHSDNKGFSMALNHGGTVNGFAVASILEFPDKISAYLSQALNLAFVSSLAIANARALHGILSVCCYCKNIQDSNGEWKKMEEFISARSQALFSHTYCPTCLETHLDDLMSDSDEADGAAP
jgi:hypothetical protein